MMVKSNRSLHTVLAGSAGELGCPSAKVFPAVNDCTSQEDSQRSSNTLLCIFGGGDGVYLFLQCERRSAPPMPLEQDRTGILARTQRVQCWPNSPSADGQKVPAGSEHMSWTSNRQPRGNSQVDTGPTGSCSAPNHSSACTAWKSRASSHR
eukprot:3036339-Amphidinium_carterae.1